MNDEHKFEVRIGRHYVKLVKNIANSPLVEQIIFKERSTTRMTTAQQCEYVHDDIGNRISTGGRASAQSSYSVNNRNQYTSRTVAGGVDVVGAGTDSTWARRHRFTVCSIESGRWKTRPLSERHEVAVADLYQPLSPELGIS